MLLANMNKDNYLQNEDVKESSFHLQHGNVICYNQYLVELWSPSQHKHSKKIQYWVGANPLFQPLIEKFEYLDVTLHSTGI